MAIMAYYMVSEIDIRISQDEYKHLLACKETLRQLVEILKPKFQHISVDDIVDVPTFASSYAIGE